MGLLGQLLAVPLQILSYNLLSAYNSLSAAIHLYMIWPQVQRKFAWRCQGSERNIKESIVFDFEAQAQDLDVKQWFSITTLG